MSLTIPGIFALNPATTNISDDLFYFVRSPYNTADDYAINWQNFSAQFTPAVLTTKGDLFSYSTTPARLAVGATNGQILQVLSSAATGLAWSTAAYPATTTINQVLYSSAANTVAGLATANSSVLITSAGGVPSLSTTLPAGLTIPGYQTTITPAALTEVSDTNVTLTLGGTPATALLQAASVTAGWSGQLSLTRGGSAANLTASAGSVVYSTVSAMAFSAVGSSGQLFQSAGTSAPGWTTNTFPSTDAKGDILYASAINTISGLGVGSTGNILTVASGLPAWTTTTYPATNAINTIMYASSANILGSISASNNGVLISSSSGVPSWLADGTTGQVLTATTGSPPTWAAASAGPYSNVVISTGNSGSFSTTSTTGVAITNLTLSITTKGGPVVVSMQSGTGAGANVYTTAGAAYIQFFRGATQLNYEEIQGSAYSVPASSFTFIDTPTTGTYTYTAQLFSSSAGNTVYATNCYLAAMEI